MPKPLELLAEKILANTKKAFCFGSVNKAPVSSRFKQASFIFSELKKLTTNEKLFENKLKQKKFLYEENRRVEALRDNYQKTNELSLGLDILAIFYEEIKASFKNKESAEWDKDWADSINAFFALGVLQKAQKEYLEKMNQKEKIKYNLYKYFCREGVSESDPEMREIYRKYTLMESVLTTTYGVGNCEPMADFALLHAIETTKDKSCEINYIRFPETEKYDEMNTIALGDWPNKGCIIISPWLGGSGKFFTWQGNLETTVQVSHYPSFKVIFTIKPGQEMEEFRILLELVNFTKKATECTPKKNTIEELADKYRTRLNENNALFETKNLNTPRPNR